MKKLYAFCALLIAIAAGQNVQAQCNDGEVEVEIIVTTDAYGYEAYWELVPGGNDCGDATIASGGNSAVGCNGGGAQDQTPGGYGNFGTFEEGPWCITEDAALELYYVDDWGDGGITFEVLVNGYSIAIFTNEGTGPSFEFNASEPAPYDMAATGSNLNPYVPAGNVEIAATFENLGTETITDFSMNYSVNGGETVTSNVTGASVANTESETFTHDIAWTPTADGEYTIEIWASNLNGNPDEQPDNDVLTIDVTVGPGIPNIIDQYIDAELQIVTIADAGDQVNKPTDLDFHPNLTLNQLWVINKDTENSGGSTVTIMNTGEPNQNAIWKRDGNAWHFMSLPTGIAFSPNGNFANSPGVLDANHTPQPNEFTGPALWSSDLDIYAEPSGGNGSHLDMLHESPYCQGIAAETGNAFWVFDGFSDDIVRYDFVEDHGPGNSYHGDAIIRRYRDDEVSRDPNHQIVSHLEMDADLQWLYVVDHGNDRVIRIDITTGTVGGTPPYGPHEQVVQYTNVTGYTQETVVSEGLTKPAGIDVIGNRMLVSEYESGDIVIYDISSMPAVELDRIETGFSSLQGIVIGPNGKIYGVDFDTETVYMVDGIGLSTENVVLEKEPRLFPNPTKDIFYVDNVDEDADFRLFDLSGKLVAQQKGQGQRVSFDLSNFPSGVYSLQIIGSDFGVTKKLVKL